MTKLERSFYLGDTLSIAKDLLGKTLYYNCNNQLMAGKIVETEAYIGPHDKGSHSYGGKITPRNRVMFGPGGYAYIYIIYGMYDCFNVVTGPEDAPEAVLIRGLEPLEGVEHMAMNRFGLPYQSLSKKQIKNLTNGPGKLCRAMGISRANNGMDLCGDSLFIGFEEGLSQKPLEIETSPRINIDYAEEYAAKPWRFYIKGNPWVSKP